MNQKRSGEFEENVDRKRARQEESDSTRDELLSEIENLRHRLTEKSKDYDELIRGIVAMRTRGEELLTECDLSIVESVRRINPKLLGLMINFDSEFDEAATCTMLCPICTEEVKIRNMIFFHAGTDHAACRDCCRSYFTSRLEANNFKLGCWFSKCKLRTHGDVPRISMGEKWDEFQYGLSLASLKSDSSMRFCTTPDCGGGGYVADGCGDYECYECRRKYCAGCDMSMHEGECREYVSKDLGKRCPGCRTYITKIEGCLLMSCTICGTKFCWLCTEICDYDHQCREARKYSLFNDEGNRTRRVEIKTSMFQFFVEKMLKLHSATTLSKEEVRKARLSPVRSAYDRAMSNYKHGMLKSGKEINAANILAAIKSMSYLTPAYQLCVSTFITPVTFSDNRVTIHVTKQVQQILHLIRPSPNIFEPF